MNIKYVAKNYKISDKFKDVIEKKLSKLDKYFSRNVEAKVNCIEQNEKERLEITLNADGLFLRVEVQGDNMYNNIDIALPKLERQVVKSGRRFKDKFVSKESVSGYEFIEAEPEEVNVKISKKKSFELDPITVEDAIQYMEGIDHPFYVFLNAETGDVNIVYKRNDGDLGLIEVHK